MKLQGSFRIRLVSAQKARELEKKYDAALRHPDPLVRADVRDAITAGAVEFDSGWKPNVVTDQGRRMLSSVAFGTSPPFVYISESTGPSNVRRCISQPTYANQDVPQIEAPSIVTLDETLLLQTRTASFDEPTVARTINTVGLTMSSSIVGGAVSGIVTFTVLSTPVNQGTSQRADVIHRLTWSLA